MPRHSLIDHERVLDAAMALFWARGYRAVAMGDLVVATGAARYGLYAAFNDKRGLYLAALDRYQQVVVNRLFAGVEAPDAGPRQVRGYFDGLLAMAASPQGSWGCLMAGAAWEMADQDAVAGRVVGQYRERLRSGFARALGGQGQRAEALIALAFGLHLQARAGVGLSSLRAAVDSVLDPMAAAER